MRNKQGKSLWKSLAISIPVATIVGLSLNYDVNPLVRKFVTKGAYTARLRGYCGEGISQDELKNLSLEGLENLCKGKGLDIDVIKRKMQKDAESRAALFKDYKVL